MVFDLANNLVLSYTDDYAVALPTTAWRKARGQFLIGVDFEKHADHSATAVLEKVKEELHLVYLQDFPLKTPYTTVTGSVKRLNEAYCFAAGYLHQTGVGEGPFDEIKQFM